MPLSKVWLYLKNEQIEKADVLRIGTNSIS